MSLPLSGLAHYFNRVGNDMEPLSVVGGFGYIGGGTGSVFSSDNYTAGFSNPFGGSFSQKYYGGFGSSQSTMMSGKAYAFDALKCYNDFRMAGSAGVQAPAPISILPPGAGSAGQSGGVNGSNRPSQTNINSNDDEENTIPEKVQEEAVERLFDMGYSDLEPEDGSNSEAAEIVARIVTASEGDRNKFNTILNEVPPKTENVNGTIVENEDWAGEFGQWYAHRIGGLSDIAAQDYVHEVAFDAYVKPENTSGSTYVSAKKGGKEQIDLNGTGETVEARIYEVTADNDTEIPVGTEIYRVGNNANSYRWYVKRGDSFVEIPFRASGNGNGATIKLYVNRADSMEVIPAGTQTDINGNVYEEYNIRDGSAAGDISNSYAGNGNLYYRDGQWYHSIGSDTDANGVSHPTFEPLENQPKLENGRLMFGGEPQYVASDNFDASMDAEDYMVLLDAGIEDARAHATEIENAENEQTTQTVEEVASQLKDLFGEAGLEVTVSEDGKKIELNATPENAAAITAVISGNKDKLNNLLASLPATTRVTLNGSLLPSSNRADAIENRLNSIDSTEPLIIAETYDLSNEDLDGIKEELGRIIKQEKISQDRENPSSVDFSNVQLPADLDRGELRSLLEEVAHEEGIDNITGFFLINSEEGTKAIKVIAAGSLPEGQTLAQAEETMRTAIPTYFSEVDADTEIEFIWWNTGESTSTAAVAEAEETVEATDADEESSPTAPGSTASTPSTPAAPASSTSSPAAAATSGNEFRSQIINLENFAPTGMPVMEYALKISSAIKGQTAYQNAQTPISKLVVRVVVSQDQRVTFGDNRQDIAAKVRLLLGLPADTQVIINMA